MNLLAKNRADTEQQYKDLTNHFGGVKADSDELKKTVLKHAEDYAALVATQQQLTQTLDQMKKELDAPILKGGSDLVESDKKAGIELQRRAHLFKGGTEDDFKPDMNNLIDATAYRSAARKLMQVGIETKDKIRRQFTAEEQSGVSEAHHPTAHPA